MIGVLVISFQLIFDVPEIPEQLLIGKNQIQVTPTCYVNSSPLAIDDDGKLNLLVWNIYKQNRPNWEGKLSFFSHNSQLLLLQEASLTDELRAWIGKKAWGSNYVKAFSVFDTGTGVINLASHFPITACAYTAQEPWIRLPKSGLYALYLLSNGQTLAVVNIHAINFTLGTLEYEQQIETLKETLLQHTGPIIMAGDYNTWSEERLSKLKEEMATLDLQEAVFSPDNRKTFINGLPLDHVFYKGLTLINAKAPITDASDHNPLLIEFETMGRH